MLSRWRAIAGHRGTCATTEGIRRGELQILLLRWWRQRPECGCVAQIIIFNVIYPKCYSRETVSFGIVLIGRRHQLRTLERLRYPEYDKRRTFVRRNIAYALMFIALSLVSVAPRVSAQDATPVQDATLESSSVLASLGLPTLEVTVTADAYEGIPDSIEAGRYLVNLTVSEDVGEFGGGIGFIQPPAEMTTEEFLQNAFGPPAGRWGQW